MATQDTTVDYYYAYYENVDPSAEVPSEEDDAYRAIQEVWMISFNLKPIFLVFCFGLILGDKGKVSRNICLSIIMQHSQLN